MSLTGKRIVRTAPAIRPVVRFSATARKAAAGAIETSEASAAAIASLTPSPAGIIETVEPSVVDTVSNATSIKLAFDPIVANEVVNVANPMKSVTIRISIILRVVVIPARRKIKYDVNMVPISPIRISITPVFCPKTTSANAEKTIVIPSVSRAVIVTIAALLLRLAPVFISAAPLTIAPPGKGSNSATFAFATAPIATRVDSTLFSACADSLRVMAAMSRFIGANRMRFNKNGIGEISCSAKLRLLTDQTQPAIKSAKPNTRKGNFNFAGTSNPRIFRILFSNLLKISMC